MRLPLIRALAAATICSALLALPAAAQAQEPPCDGDTLVLGSSFGWDMTADADCAGIPPEARFTMNPPSTTPGGTVQFDGSTSTDTGGFINLYEWDLDGDGAFDDGTGANPPGFTYDDKGSYAVSLRVTDAEGLTDVETQNLAVTTPPVPELVASPTSPLTGDTFTLDASLSADPDGAIVGYEWDTNADGEVDHDTQGNATLDLALPFAGSYDLTVIVRDDTGAKAQKTIQVVVQNRAPVAAIDDPGLVLSGRSSELSAASSSDADLPPSAHLTYDWDLDDDGVYETTTDSDPTIDHTFTVAGPATVGVRVTDEAGASATTTRALVVTHAPVVVLSATPNTASLDEDVVIDASASSDPDGPGALTYEWAVPGDPAFVDPGGAQITIHWATAGTKTVNVTVTDASGAKTDGQIDVVVRNQAPLPALSVSPATPAAGQVVQLSAIGTADPDGTIVRYQWDLDGDGGYERDTQGVPNTTASFANPGTVTVGVRVTDDDGGTATKAVALTVLPADSGDGPQDPVQPKPPAPQPPTHNPGGAAPPAGGDQTPTEPAGAPTDGFEPTPERPFGAWLGGNPIQRTQTVVKRGLLVSCRTELAVWCSFTVTVAKTDAKRLKLGKKDTVVAKSALPVAAGTSARARIKLTARARKALRGKGGVRVLVHAVATTADGREVALNRVILVRP